MPALASANDIYRVHSSAQDIIKRALRLIGVLEAGDPLPAEQLSDALEAFNDMVDAWNTEKLVIWVLVRTPLTLTAGTNPHEIGPGSAVFDKPRPNRIVQGQAFLTGGQLGTDETELKVQTHNKWAEIHDSALSGIPCEVYYEASFPLGNIWFDVKPDAAYSLVLYLEQMLHQVFLDGSLGGDGTTTQLDLPLGYKEAIVHNLAVRLAPEYGRSASAEAINTAVEAKASIKRLNMKPIFTKCDVALLDRRGGTYDILRGD